MQGFSLFSRTFLIQKPSKRCINFIKNVGRTPISKKNLDKNVVQVIKYMRAFPTYLSVQRACCHTISNICMDVECAKRLVIDYSIHVDVMNAIKQFYDKDWKLCWLACSAIWNMTRSNEARCEFPLSIVNLLMKVLVMQPQNQYVVNTALGCLSNLSLNHVLKRKIGEVENMLNLLRMMERNISDVTVSATAAGLIANLAVNDTIAHRLVDFGAIGTLRRMFSFEYDDVVFLRNSVAALGNCSTSSLFLERCIENKIVEILYGLLQINNDLSINALIANSLHALGLQVGSKTTSFHLASMHGLVNAFDRLMFNNDEEEDIDFNSKDKNGQTMISYAIHGGHSEMVAFLACCDAKIGDEDLTKEISQDFQDIIKCSQKRAINVRNEYVYILNNTLPLNLDIITTINTYLSSHSLIRGKDGSII